MNAIELLKKQHREVEELFTRYEAAGEKAHKTKQELFEKIADRLAGHASIEENTFYPGIKAENTQEILLESLEEHLAVKRVIADLLDLDPTDETYDAKMKVLKDLVDHHVKEEEKTLFPKVEKIVDEKKLEQLGTEMQRQYQELEKAEPRFEVPSQTATAPPLG
ncbi:MAG: hemerythrin domain-containing protein [Candidatus Eisenbacteria bacterium]|nr:hemerythrin domain-containing protein [Candidatus Eisenbacteria bacterium]